MPIFTVKYRFLSEKSQIPLKIQKISIPDAVQHAWQVPRGNKSEIWPKNRSNQVLFPLSTVFLSSSRSFYQVISLWKPGKKLKFSRIFSLKYDAPASTTMSAILLDDVINNLELNPEHYKKSTLTFTRKNGDKLMEMFREALKNWQINNFLRWFFNL